MVNREPNNTMAQNWIMIISELRRYQGVCYKSDITVISGAAFIHKIYHCKHIICTSEYFETFITVKINLVLYNSTAL